MYLYVETWNAKPAWQHLDRQRREEFIGRVQSLLGELVGDQLRLLGCSICDADTHRHGGYQYVAVWQASDRAQIRRIEEGTDRIGWHDYFDQVNYGSTHVGPEALIQHMLEA